MLEIKKLAFISSLYYYCLRQINIYQLLLEVIQ